jgi:sugar lactone lactonase YvrE
MHDSGKLTVNEAEPLLDRCFILGEGPAYDMGTDTILWVDIKAGSLLLWNCKTRKLQEIQTGQYLGAVVPVENGGYLAAMTTGIYYLNEMGLRFMCRPAELKDNLRLNDAKCDPAGRLWFGTLGLFKNNAPEGSLLRLDHDGTCHRVLEGVKVSNGLAWSADGKTMFFIDTPQKGVDTFDYDIKDGSISNRRRVINFPDNFPDGMTIDAEDKLWVALWGAGKVVRCDPLTGGIIKEIPISTANVSSCCFAGKDLDDLIITTSGEGFSDAWAGRIYHVKPGVRGTPTIPFKDCSNHFLLR